VTGVDGMIVRVLLILAVTSGVRDGWGCSSAGRAPALQAGGQRFDPAQLHQIFVLTLSQQSCFAADGAANDGRRALALANLDGSRDVALVWRDETISFEENKVCELPMGVSPVLKNCEEKIDLEASRYCEFRLTMSETFPIDP
jgi:hypothetical protein